MALRLANTGQGYGFANRRGLGKFNSQGSFLHGMIIKYRAPETEAMFSYTFCWKYLRSNAINNIGWQNARAPAPFGPGSAPTARGDLSV